MRSIRAALVAALTLSGSFSLFAQEGFPLEGSWSGDRQVNGQSSRVLVVMQLQRDQSVTGFALEDGKRQPLQNVQLNPADWTVSFSIDGGYQVQGSLEELGSATLRRIVGKWTQGDASGDFALELN
ncbi:MAG: hypothetical protein LBE21_04410 [Pseudomonadales bacterium]|nr:hypothetical protein [Pseudomonadales bacterium]